MAFIMTRINVGNYDEWKPLFDKDLPKAREQARSVRVFRSLGDPGEVHILIEFESVDDAAEARRRLLDSGVLDRFSDKSGPTIIEEADT